MDNYMDHLLILDEMSASLIQHAADKARTIANRAVDDNNTLNRQASLAREHGRERAANTLTNQAQRAGQFATKKYAQSDRLNNAAAFRTKLGRMSTPSRSY